MRTAVLKDGRRVEVVEYDPYPHQLLLAEKIRERIKTNTGPQFFVPVWHRRAGKSSALVNILIEACCNPKTVGQYYYFYPMKDKVREHLWDNPQVLPKYLPMSQVKKKDDQRMVVYFHTGSQLIFDGSDKDPDKHRGGSGRGYVVDEYDDQQRRILDEIIRPIVEFNKGFVVLSGTPRGLKHLHEAYVAGQDPQRPQWWSSLMPANTSVDGDGNRLFTDLQLTDIKKDYERVGIGSAYNQEYLCHFNSDANQVFRKIEQVTVDDYGEPLEEEEPEPGKYYRIGCDPAITTDYWVNSVWDLHTNHEVFIERFQPMDTALGEARLEALYRKYGNAEIYMDESGLGMIIADHFRSKGIGVIPIKTAQMKERIVTNLSIKIDNMTIRLLPDTIAMEELRAFTFNRLPSGRYQFSAPTGKHDDTVIARAIAVFGIEGKLPPVRKNEWNPFEETQTGSPRSYFRKNNTYFGFKKHS